MAKRLTRRSTVVPIWPAWQVKLVCSTVFCWLVSLACVQLVGAQASDHQRLGVEPQAYWEADIELAVRLIPAGYSDYGLPDLGSSFSIGLLLDRKWSAGLVVPARLIAGAGDDVAWFLIPGDATASIGWTGIRGDSRLWGGFNLTGPSAHWQGDQEVPGAMAGGSGRWTLGLSGGISRIIDPLVLGGLLSWSVGLPREERWDKLWRPGDFSLVLSVTEAFNEQVSCTATLTHYVSLPESSWGMPVGKPQSMALGYDAVAGIKLLVSGQSVNAGVGISKGIVHGSDPGTVNFSVGYTLRQKEDQ